MSIPPSKLGAFVVDKGVDFGVWAPFASSVSVMGSFNEWSKTANPLAKSPDGCWRGHIDGVKIGQEYKYIVKNGQKELERNDPRAVQLTASGDATVIIEPEFNWGNDSFKMPPPNQQIIYELHIGTFNRTDPATPGTFETATAKLDYLADLGVNVVELMPVSGTNVERWWGYDPTYLYAVDAAYGGHHAFLEFVKQAHRRGIGVIVDVVYNHLSPFPGLDLWQFDGWNENDRGGIYFYNDERGDTPWGPRPDYGRPEVRSYITENVRMWLTDCHVDGLRLDAVFTIRNTAGQNNDPTHDLADGWRLLQDINTSANQISPDAIIIAEDMAINDWITKPVKQGGAGFRSQWETCFPTKLRDVLNPADDNNRHLNELSAAITRVYNQDAFGRVIYSESHDADANGHQRMNEEIAPGHPDNLFARRRSALAAAIALTGPGIPMLFQGQEFMEGGWFTHWRAIEWELAGKFKGIVQLYHDLIALRRNRYDITRGLLGQGTDITHLCEAEKILAYHRWDKGGPKDDVIVVINFTNKVKTDYALNFPRDGKWRARFNSDWNGYSPDFTDTQLTEVEVKSGKGKVNLGPYSLVLLSQDA